MGMREGPKPATHVAEYKRPIADLESVYPMLQRGPSKETFAAPTKSDDRRIHTMWKNRDFYDLPYISLFIFHFTVDDSSVFKDRLVMQKIDLHIHTVSSNQDREFLFSEEKLQQYINEVALNCIAITNHNLFDKQQFKRIRATSDIVVLPGIEVDVEKCHLLVIADGNDLEDFDTKCAEIQSMWAATGKPLSFEDFRKTWGDLSQYILIPHYEKNPRISPEVLEKFGGHITSGEVSNPKKFVACIDDIEKLVPLFFSDCRVDSKLDPLPTRQTYIDCDDVSFGTLREVFRDKSKVALTEDEGNRLFQVFSDGQHLSTGLNVILGDRSSGKSHTLQRICDWFGDDCPSSGFLEPRAA
jgi:hypothetical protein